MFDWSVRVNGIVSQTVSQKHVYLIRRNVIFYFSRRAPSDLQTRLNKERVMISLRARSRAKAEKSAEALSDRLERYWDGLNVWRKGFVIYDQVCFTALPSRRSLTLCHRYL